MTAYQLRIVPTEHDPRILPRADVYTPCARAGCTREYRLPPPGHRSPDLTGFDDIVRVAVWDGWTYTVEHGVRCPDHRYGVPVGELTTHEAAQVTTDTAALPVEEIKAALEEGEDDAE